jgi:Ribonuclease T2 family
VVEQSGGSHEWDVLIFTQHWPATVCIQWKEKVETHTCTITKDWGIHGVW